MVFRLNKCNKGIIKLNYSICIKIIIIKCTKGRDGELAISENTFSIQIHDQQRSFIKRFITFQCRSINLS